MAAVRPFLTRAVEQVKRFADSAPTTRGITDTMILEDIRRAHAGIFEDISKAIGNEAQYFYSVQSGITLVEDQAWMRTPPSFRRFHHLVQRDSENARIVTRRLRHTPGRQNDPRGVIPVPDLRRLRFHPIVSGAEAGENWELAFESGPIELHFGSPATSLANTALLYTDSTKTISKASAFTNYTYRAGDILKITGGTAVTVARYAIASKVDNDSITLSTSAGAGGTSDVVADVYKVDRMVFTASPTVGELYDQNDYYIGARPYIVSGFGIEEHNGVKAYTETTRVAELTDDWSEVPDDASVYELRPWVPGGPDQFDEVIALRASLKLRRIRGDDPSAESAVHREIKHIMGEIIRHIADVNTDKGQSWHRPRTSRNTSIWG